MPAHSLNLSAAPRHRPAIMLVAGLCAALLCPFASAVDVLVVTDSRHPVQALAGARVIELDQATRIEAELASHLRQRLRDGGEALQRRIGHAYQGVADAWGLGIAKIPAVVVDRRYVIYGEPDVARAVARIDTYRSTQP
jgi:integrating conjugative element protein (TIGR03757 family)